MEITFYIVKSSINSEILRTYFIEIILVVIIIAVFFVVFTILELNQASVTESLLKKQANLQLIDNHVIALAVSSQLEDIETKIGDSAADLSDVKNFQSEQTHSMLENTFQNVEQDFPDTILYLLDKNDIIIDGVNYNNLTFNGKSLAYREDIKTVHSTLKEQVSNGFYGIDGKFRITVSYPIFDKDKNLIGIIGASTPSDLYFSKLANASSTQSQFSNIFDKNQTYLSTPRKFLIGDSYFSDKVQSYFGRNDVQNKQYSTVFSGTPSSSIYNFGGERINTGYPVEINGENQYFVFVITPTDSIYADSNAIYFSQIIELVIVFTITICVILFLIRKSLKASRIETELGLKYRNLYENSPDLLRTIDLNGIITDCNRAYAENLGYTREEAVGMPILDHTAENSLTEMSSQFKEWKTSRKIINKEIWLKRKDKTVFPALLSGTNIYDYNGKVIGRTVSLRDMTEIYDVRKTLEANNQRLQEQYKEVLRLVGRLEEVNENLRKEKKQSAKLASIGEKISQMNHNLRNPLHVMMMNAELINMVAKKDGNENIIAKSEAIKKASDSMLTQIEDLMNFIRDETLELEKKSLNEILNDAVSLVKKPDTISIQLPEKDIVCRCDPHKIQVVFMNLFTNAIEAMGNTGKIIVRSKETGTDVIIEVENSGESIPPEIMPRIFDPLFTTKKSGTGLGLPYCKNIIAQHGGTISVNPNPTVFTIVLPK